MPYFTVRDDDDIVVRRERAREVAEELTRLRLRRAYSEPLREDDTMTRQDYEFLARVLEMAAANARVADQRQGVMRAAMTLAVQLGNRYPNFDEARFLAAVGVPRGTPRPEVTEVITP